MNFETLLLSLGTIITIVTAFLSSNRSAYDRVENIIRDVTLGEVAEARHKVGTFWGKYKNYIEENKKINVDNPEDEIDALFKIIWALRRVAAVENSISFLNPGPKKLLRDTLGNWVQWSVGEENVIGKLDNYFSADIGELQEVKSFAKSWK